MSTSNFYGRTLPKTIDGLLPLVLSDFEVDADTVQENLDYDVLIQIYNSITDCTPTSSDKHSREVRCGM